ncbi:uncharacterized protein LOC119858003 isoform X2 [Dermochelys coriacea]|uniref:uncharacterized protein LOC119858003 isoform X2 n=1 Tax=Dermochelys coriacea TaxID=27794 RepID=UPI001CA9A6D3|nr:uncharacterized protein LOC119858003 isoform X2 [Dermochelys coriacea]
MLLSSPSRSASGSRRSPPRRWSWAPGALGQWDAPAEAPRSVAAAPGTSLHFYVLWSLQEPPRQLRSKSSQMCYQIQLPLPLPKQLVVFGLGDWNCYSQNTSITVEVLVNPDVKPQRIGKLGSDVRSLVWEGDWRVDILMSSLKQMDCGNPVKLLLTVNGQLLKGIYNSTPTCPFLAPEPTQSPVLLEDTMSPIQVLDDTTEVKRQSLEVTARAQRTRSKDLSPPAKKLLMPFAPESPTGQKAPKEARKKICKPRPIELKNPRKVLFEPRACEGEQDAEVCPSPRWCHAMCLSDSETAILIGGEGANQQPCKDALWKLEIDNDFWFPMDLPPRGSVPPCSRGHTATYDLDTKRIYVFGGMKESKLYSTIYILDTATWKWLLVAATGKVPTLAYHSATIYRKELFIFGGTFPKMASLESRACSNTLYVFNPEYKIWYQPIVEGEKPLPRLGHSATLLRNKLVIFGGQRTPLYLNDVHILDLGYMEYVPVPCLSGQPSSRCFHAAMPVSDQKVLISGGCNAKGALQDVFTFHLDTFAWSTVTHSHLSFVPRAGHTLLNLTAAHLTDVDKESQGKCNLCTVLVFGGSDCAGTFYNSTSKIQLDLEETQPRTAGVLCHGK